MLCKIAGFNSSKGLLGMGTLSMMDLFYIKLISQF